MTNGKKIPTLTAKDTVQDGATEIPTQAKAGRIRLRSGQALSKKARKVSNLKSRIQGLSGSFGLISLRSRWQMEKK